MTSATSLLIMIAGAETVALAAGLCLRRPLHRMLEDQCGGSARARFWTAFFGLLLLMLPVLAVAQNIPDSFADQPQGALLLGVTYYGTLGTAGVLLLLGFGLWRGARWQHNLQIARASSHHHRPAANAEPGLAGGGKP
ncbi:MAG: hypothetical protein GC191_09885 [Azospirillum sp.]|nr:hypothetical protein [Azospirillum sp.]